MLVSSTGVEADAAALIPHELVQLHEGTCSERVHEYAIFETLLGETQTTAACAMLEGRLELRYQPFCLPLLLQPQARLCTLAVATAAAS